MAVRAQLARQMAGMEARKVKNMRNRKMIESQNDAVADMKAMKREPRQRKRQRSHAEMATRAAFT